MNQAIFYMILSTIFFSLGQACVKVLSHLPAHEVVFFRAILTLFLTFWVLKRKKISYWGTHKKVLWGRGFFGALALFLSFLSFQILPLATATTLFNISPILTVLISSLILKEHASLKQWIGIFVAFFGVVIVMGVDKTHSLLFLIPLLGSFFVAIAYNCIRYLKDKEDPFVIIFYFPFATLPLCLPMLLYSWVTPQGFDWIFLFLIGLLTQFGQVFLTLAYQKEKASKISVFNYFSLFWAAFLGWFFFQEMPTLFLILGMLMVIGGAVLSSKGV